ncbi:MAG TPA: flagella basal body P-ring formation protein FlgA [Phycisphaerales bacterium]|nr:flagella basal body P-ring formation protein FlgA [Phycisphaerales bacterium]
MIRALVMTIAGLLTLSPAWGADAVRLRSAASVAGGRPVTLADVADLEGDAAGAFGGLVLVADPAARALSRPWLEIGISEVRGALRDAGAREARIALSGESCIVRLLASPNAPPGDEQGPHRASPDPLAPVDPGGSTTVRAEVARVLSELLGVDWPALRLRFDAEDRAFVDAPAHGRRVSIVPSSTAGARMLLSVRLFAGESLEQQRTVGVEAEVRRAVLVLSRDIDRRSPVERDAIASIEAWIAPGGNPPIDRIEDAVGAVARRPLRTGEVLRAGDVEPAIAVRRGEITTVHCLRGGVALQTRARARADGRIGDVVEFKIDASGRSFVARVDGKGVAVADLDASAPIGNDKESGR